MKQAIALSGLALALALIASGAFAAFSFVLSAQALSSDYVQPCVTASATGTLAYMTPGAATTTLSCPLNSIHRLATDTAILHLQVTATSTGVTTPTLKARVEVSRNNVDWYPLAVPNDATPSTATTTDYTTDPYANLSFKLSTTTAPAGDFGGSGSATRLHYSIELPSPEPYIRVIFTSPTGGGNVGLWAELYGKIAAE